MLIYIHGCIITVIQTPFSDLQSLRFSKEDIENVRCILAAILHLGNVQIAKDGDGESSRMANMKPVSMHEKRERQRKREKERKREGGREGGRKGERERKFGHGKHHYRNNIIWRIISFSCFLWTTIV